MSSDAKLQKVTLGTDWIDLSFGEPKVVMQAMFRQLNRVGTTFKMPDMYDLNKWEYQPAAGNKDLVELLENKYGAKVVVCNGAKQALAASLGSFQKNGIRSVFYETPYYPANPGFVHSAGLSWAPFDRADSSLITSPNNPDGKNLTNIQLVGMQTQKPMIHDAAYYTPVYLPEGQLPIPLGRMQIYSMSKMYGLSGLRVGYIVCHDEKFYNDAVNFMEETTAGVSTASQQVALEIERFFEKREYLEEFEQEARDAIKAARQELLALDHDVLIPVPSDANSMFAWCIAGPALDATSAKVYFLDGSIFGRPGMMRLNIAHPIDTIRQAVERLNLCKIRS